MGQLFSSGPYQGCADEKLIDSTESPPGRILLPDYEDKKLRDGLYVVDVLADKEPVTSSNPEWSRFGESLARRIIDRGQHAFLVSPEKLDYYMDDRSIRSNDFASFKQHKVRWFVTRLERTRLEQILRDLCQSEEFVTEQVWLCLFGEETSAHELCKDNETTLVREMNLISDKIHHYIVEKDLTLEWVCSVSNCCPTGEIMWFNPTL